MSLVAIPTTSQLDEVTQHVVFAAMDLHRAVGRKLSEAAYESGLAHMLRERGFQIERQKPLSLRINNTVWDCGIRVDIVVNECLLVDVQTFESCTHQYDVQMLANLRRLDYRLGLILNFRRARMEDGIRRIVNKFSMSALPKITPVK